MKKIYIKCRAVGKLAGTMTINKSNNRKIHTNNLFHLGFVEVISSAHKGVKRGVFLDNHLPSTDNLTKIINTHKHTAEHSNTNRNFTKR